MSLNIKYELNDENLEIIFSIEIYAHDVLILLLL